MGDRQQPPVIVGVDGSAASLSAAEYAVDEATLRKAPLLILYGHLRRSPVSLWRRKRDPYVIRGIRRLLDAVAERARIRGPNIDIVADVLVEEPGAALVARSGHAQLVVVGHSGRGGAALGSVAAHVAAHAGCPVIVHRPITGETRPARRGLVIVGVDGSAVSTAALRFALDEAALRGAQLEVVQVWTHPPGAEPAGVHPDAYDYAEAKAEAERMLAELLAGTLTEYPEVAVTRTVIHSLDAAHVLVDQSRRAQLIVVGSRGRGGVARLLLGSVSQALINDAGCPVAVVPAAAAGGP